jgi:hypothetical protein
MGQFQRPSDNSDPLKATLYRERAAECRRRAEDEDLGHIVRESYRALVQSYEMLAEEADSAVATRQASRVQFSFVRT